MTTQANCNSLGSERSKDIRKLIDAAYRYAEVRRRYGNLSNVDLSRFTPYSYEILPCHPAAKQEFDQAEQELVAALDIYVESRVNAVIKASAGSAPNS